MQTLTRRGSRRASAFSLAAFLALFALAVLSGCAAQATHDAAPPPPSAPASPPSPDAAAQNSALAGTQWRLVEILSMDGNVFKPQDTTNYTLTLAANGKAAVLGDCNRGAGTWTSAGASQIRFSPLATTRMKCPPDSLSERYLAQFEWIRSYVMRDGHLFLATMADGAIIEFEPLQKP